MKRALLAQLAGVVASGRAAAVDFRLGFTSAAALAGDYATTPDDAIFSQTAALTIAFKVYVPVVGGFVYSLRGILSQWDWSTLTSARLAVTLGNTDANHTFAVFIGNGVDNTTVASATAQNNSLVRGTETEIAIVYSGAGVGNAGRLRLFSRPVGGTWVESTNTYGGTVPATLPNTAAALALGRWTNRPGNAQMCGNLWDVRWFSAAVVPSGTSDLPLTSCVERWRFREGRGTTATGEIAGKVLTLASTVAGRRPGWRLASWRGGSTATGPKILCMVDSKTDGSLYDGAWRVEFRNRMTGFHRQQFQFVGRFTDASPPPDFAFNDESSALAGTWLDDGTANDALSWIPVDVAAYDPRVLILLGGTNDVANGATDAQTLARLGACIDAAYAAKPTLKIRVVSDPPVNTAYSATQAAYATGTPALCAAKAALGIDVACIDVASVMSVNDLGDTVHPFQTGYEKMAERIVDAVVADLAT